GRRPPRPTRPPGSVSGTPEGQRGVARGVSTRIVSRPRPPRSTSCGAATPGFAQRYSHAGPVTPTAPSLAYGGRASPIRPRALNWGSTVRILTRLLLLRLWLWCRLFTEDRPPVIFPLRHDLFLGGLRLVGRDGRRTAVTTDDRAQHCEEARGNQ